MNGSFTSTPVPTALAGLAGKVVSVVIPLYNEEANLQALSGRVLATLGALSVEWEVVFIDDGSDDGTFAKLKVLAAENPRVKVLRFSRNFNQHAAIAAGFAQAKGDYVVLMDGDLQDVPEEMPKLLEKITEGFDVVYGLRQNRQDSWFKKLSSRAFYLFFSSVTRHHLPEGLSTFRVVSRRFANAFCRLSEHDRFTAGLMAWLGFSVATVPVVHEPRVAGVTKYPIGRLISFSVSAIVAFSDVPLRLATMIGMVMSCISLLLSVYVAYLKMTRGYDVLGWASLMSAILLIGGIQLIFIGILGRYIALIFNETKGRPLYVVAETLNLD